ncbi:PREDICTED: uncharacterized protein LOC107331931 [Acropora digitifera]|uniref:uncharacterized protein LOC107331931 n=1 Tax=Acropora digitifera TaxID=70779 RepID=UPI00077AD958|nr:PREDICTED: uncharacterized protein LOC107331931 [Acropora digitifera]
MDISRLDSDISIGTLEEERPQRISNYGSVVTEPEADGAELDEPAQQEPDRSFCRCKSSCKTKQKNEGGCPCRTANLPFVPSRCKCGTAHKPCANQNPQTVSQENLPSSSMERQRRDIENTRQEIQVRVISFYAVIA